MSATHKTIGTFYMGNAFVDLSVREGTGGEFWATPKYSKLPLIQIGIDCTEPELARILLHEALEMKFTAMYVRYENSITIANDAADYLFMFNHVQFSEACACAAEFVHEAFPVLKKAWEKRRKKKK